jgi:hypothetical protein
MAEELQAQKALEIRWQGEPRELDHTLRDHHPIEYMPLTMVSSRKAIKFLDQIIHRFGLPNNIIIYLGT